uniref:Putative secreted peptide n=1 Tax=Anopheles braziliensis TaxID=58242 RepID=A0A2M3ZN25_9DIPT
MPFFFWRRGGLRLVFCFLGSGDSWNYGGTPSFGIPKKTKRKCKSEKTTYLNSNSNYITGCSAYVRVCVRV